MAHIQMSFYSNALKKNANVMIFLPTQDADDYLFGSGNAKYDPDKKYQTLYLLHGSYGDCMDWGRLASVERYAQQHCLAVVMPSAENSSYLNMDYGEAYLDYIGRELPAFLRIMFPLSERREDTFIAGLSMGGYGAWRLGLEFPEQYGAIASLSGGMEMKKIHAGHSAHMDKMDRNYQAAVNGERNLNDPRNDLLQLLQQDIAEGNLYVVTAGDTIHGVFFFLIGPDPTYSYIENGAWHADRPYGTIHRIAGDGSGGILRAAVEFGKQRTDYLRIDTHEDNSVMQRAVEKQGFRRCGIIYLADGSPRIAYDLTV